jgi:hypothetical protein
MRRRPFLLRGRDALRSAAGGTSALLEAVGVEALEFFEDELAALAESVIRRK